MLKHEYVFMCLYVYVVVNEHRGNGSLLGVIRVVKRKNPINTEVQGIEVATGPREVFGSE